MDGRGVAEGSDAVGRGVVGAGGVAPEGRGGITVADAVPGEDGVGSVLGGAVPDCRLVGTLGEGVAAGERPATPQPLPSASNAISSKQREPRPPLMEPV